MNPIEYARHLSSYSTTGIAKQLGVSRQYMSRLGQGLYDKPNKLVLDWTTETINKSLSSPVTPQQIQDLYQSWQWDKRNNTKVSKALKPCSVTEHDKVRQPVINQNDGHSPDLIYYHKIFRQWMEDYWPSTHAFCVDMCLHPSPVVDYVDGNTHTMPNHLKSVMTKLELIGEGFKTNER